MIVKMSESVIENLDHDYGNSEMSPSGNLSIATSAECSSSGSETAIQTVPLPALTMNSSAIVTSLQTERPDENTFVRENPW